MKNIFRLNKVVLIILILATYNATSQCSVDAGPNILYANCGQQTYLSASVLSDSAVLTSDFNGGALGSGWSSSVNGQYTNPCGPTLDGTPALWFGNVPAPRTVTTNAFDVSCGGQVCFDFNQATQGGAIPCEGPDLVNEGVYFQYSINGGVTWIDIFYFQPGPGGTSGPYLVWANYCFAIPAAAMTPNTMFQWDQPVVSGAGNDHWGIDNVSIIPAICSVGNFDWSNIPGTGNGFDQWVSPLVTTTYIVTFSDGIISCSDTVTVIVPPTSAAATAVSNNVVCPNCTDLDVQFTNYNAGSIIDDFDPGINGTMWDDIQNGTVGTACGAITGNSLRFDGVGDRYAATVPVDATAGCGFMGFSLFIGNTGSGGTCENADAGEDVVLEYSINSGASWTIINTYYQSNWDINNSWQNYVTPIPPPAQTTNTQFRWRQVAFTNAANNDNWALDNISYVCNPPAFDIVWTPAITLNNNTIQSPIACPLDTTTYSATITDPATGCSATASITINVSCFCMFTSLTASVSSCENGNEFNVSGSFIYIENPGTGTIVVEAINNSGTYTQIINGPFTDLTLTNYSISAIIADGSPVTINVYFSDDLNCISTINDVSPVLPEVLLTSGSGVYCLGQAVDDIMVNVTGNAPFTLDYMFNGVPQSSMSALASFNLGNLPGDYVITNISDSGCTNLAVGNETIIVRNVPTVTSIQNGGVYCANEVIGNVFATVTGTGPWDLDFTLNGIPMTITSTIDSINLGILPGTYQITGITDAGCSNAAVGTQTILVNALPVIFAGNDFTNCEDSPITLTATGASNYVWDNNVTQGVAFIPTGTLTYTVTATDGNGCVGTDDVKVTFEPTPQPSFVADSISGCEPMTVIFTNTTAGNFIDCSWIFGDGNTGTGCADISNTYQNGGIYDVTLSLTSVVGCANSITYNDYIYVEHNPSASFIPSLYTVLSLDTEVSFDNTTSGAVTYIWDFGDDSDQSTVLNPTHEFPGEQTSGYFVTLYAYSPIGCVDTTHVVIQVNEEVIYYIPNTFTPDGDEFNQTFQPIFTAGYDPYDFNMKIFNRWGEIIFETNDDKIGWDGTYNGQVVQDGIYNWTIEFKTMASDERISISGHVVKTN